MPIEVIDLFAGPGGLGEGFCSFTKKNEKPFKIKISIEKEHFAHQTLKLRSFYRQFKTPPSDYYEYLREEITRDTLFDNYPKEAEAADLEAYCAELGSNLFPHKTVLKRILSQVKDPRNSIVIGGPPCQAYSLAGRSKMAKKKDFQKDPRHTLYKEYLKIIAEIQPRVFVMENVKGILSSKLDGEYIFDRILEDIETPSKIIKKNKQSFNISEKYTIYSLSHRGSLKDLKRNDFIIKSEEYGIPQCRHRVILLAVRNDIKVKPSVLIRTKKRICVEDVLADLPRLRSGLSRDIDSFDNWKQAIFKKFQQASTYDNLTRGGEFIPSNCKPSVLKKWFYDERIGGVLNHSSRSHIESDLHRYYYISKYACNYSKSPKLEDLPNELLPNHKNVRSAIKSGSLFNDRFKVQLANKPATTITSHIAKDGHYFIHYDPKQCRSLTVREAARIQTFPDNYKFEGPRTSQYQQVGNAVPPLLAYQIAKVVYELLSEELISFDSKQ